MGTTVRAELPCVPGNYEFYVDAIAHTEGGGASAAAADVTPTLGS